jgi:hypothetical protein
VSTEVTVTGTLVDAAGVGCTGTVTFRPTRPLYDSSGQRVVGTAPTVATITDGEFSIVVYATDDLLPAGATYTVTEAATDATPRTFRAVIPAANASLRYEDIV